MRNRTIYTLVQVGLILSVLSAFADNKDTIIVNLDKNSKVIFYVDSLSDMKNISDVDLNEIVKSLTQNVTGQISDTTLVLSEEDFYKKEDDGVGPEIKIELGNRSDAKGLLDISVSSSNEEEEDSIPIQGLEIHTQLAWGVNNYLDPNKDFPDEYGAAYGLRPLGSRYFSIGSMTNVKLGGENSPFYLKTGLELSWNNYMFESNNILTVNNDQNVFSYDSTYNYKKNKLTTSTLSIPVIFNLGTKRKYYKALYRQRRFNTDSARWEDQYHYKLKEGHGFVVGFGGYAGYRLGSHTKVFYQDGSDWVKDKEHKGYFLTNFRYGLIGRIGWRNINMFARYDLNTLFAPGKGPELNSFSFGFIL